MEYKLIRSQRRTISISVDRTPQVVVRTPLRFPVSEIEQFLEKHQSWINKQMSQRHAQIAAHAGESPLTPQKIQELRQLAAERLPGRVTWYGAQMGLSPSGIKVTSAVTRWGSCSAKNGLCFSYRLMLLEPELVDLVVVHELCHIPVKNHGKSFYKLLEQILPDYREREQLLKIRARELTLF